MADSQAWSIGTDIGSNAVAQQRARSRQLEDEQRAAKEAALASQLASGSIDAGTFGRGIHDLYQHEPQESRFGRIKRGLERAVGLRKQAAQQKQQADQKLAAQPSPSKDFARIEARVKPPETAETAEARKHGYAMAEIEARNKGAVETQDERNKKPFAPPKVVAQPKPVFKVLRGHEVLIDPVTKQVTKDFGPVGTTRTTQRQSLQYDADGVPHMVTLTSVSTPGGGSVDVDMAPDAGGGTVPPKGPAPKKSAAPRAGSPASPKPNQLDFRKGTPAGNKAKGDYVEAVKLSSIADQVAQHPSDAINQKRLAVALERASAGRFTTQALDYIIKSGWGNTIEQWANNPTTGALPADVLRQLVDGAHQNLKAAEDAVKATSGPAPKGDAQGGDKEIQYKIVNGELVPQ